MEQQGSKLGENYKRNEHKRKVFNQCKMLTLSRKVPVAKTMKVNNKLAFVK